MKRIVLNVKPHVFEKLACLAISEEKSFSQLVIELFEKDDHAQKLYDEMYQKEFEKLTREEECPQT